MSSKFRTISLVLACAAALAACETPKPYQGPTDEVCTGVNAMIAQEIKAKYDVTTGRQLATKLSAAAEADVAQLKKFTELGGKLEVEAKLGTELKGTVETKAAVTTEFFQQDQTFAQTACWLKSVLAEKNLSAGDRSDYEAARKSIAKNRVQYLDLLTGLKKS